MRKDLRIAVFAVLVFAFAVGIGSATETVPCLLAGGVSFAPTELLPSVVQCKIDGRPPTFQVENVRLVPLRRFVNATGGQLSWNAARRESIAEWRDGSAVVLRSYPNASFWQQPAVAAIADFVPTFTTAICKRVVDGDTIELVGGERVRYIGIDTPETKHPHKPVQAFGREASAYNSHLVCGKEIRLEYDVEKRDRYGRLLAYVYVEDNQVNSALLSAGYAQTATYPPNVRYASLFTHVQQAAQDSNKGLWGKPADNSEVSRLLPASISAANMEKSITIRAATGR